MVPWYCKTLVHVQAICFCSCALTEMAMVAMVEGEEPNRGLALILLSTGYAYFDAALQIVKHD